uniref:YLP motif-containing protein 1 n=1 Tax=Zeugodacus cucurbitae TaxID=28588 RepID=A0A0A1WSQ0_ZEUCU
MWNQWAGLGAGASIPPIPAPQCPPPQPPPPSVAPPPPTTAPPPTPTEQTTPIIGPMLPGSVSATNVTAATSTPGGPYGQYTEAQYAALTPEQQYALQQHWQQWQAYQQEYAKWHAQYGEQYKREMAAAALTGQSANVNNYYHQAQIQTQQPQIQSIQQPPPPPPSDGQTNVKISGTPQIYTQPPPMPIQPHSSLSQVLPVNQGSAPIHQPPPVGPYPNINYPQWTPSYQQPQQQFNYNQPPPGFNQQPTNFGQMPNFQQPPPMVAKPQQNSKPHSMPTAPQVMQKQQLVMPTYGNPNSNSNQIRGSNNCQSSSVRNDISDQDENSWKSNSNLQGNENNKNQDADKMQWNHNKNNFNINFGSTRSGNSCMPNERAPNNWDRKNEDPHNANEYELSNDNINAPSENRNSRDGFDSRWRSENDNNNEGHMDNVSQTRREGQGSTQWNNNRSQGGSAENYQESFNNSNCRNNDDFNSQRNQYEHNDQSGNRWGNRSGQFGSNDRNERHFANNNYFNNEQNGNERNFDGPNFLQNRNNTVNRRFGQNDRNSGVNFKQRSGDKGPFYGQRYDTNDRNNDSNNSFGENNHDNFAQDNRSNVRSNSNDRNFSNRDNFNRCSDMNEFNNSPRNNFSMGPDHNIANNPFSSSSRSNSRNLNPPDKGDCFGLNGNFNSKNNGNGNGNVRNHRSNESFNNSFNRSNSNEKNFGPNNFNRRSNSNERNFGQNTMNRKSNSNDRNFGSNSNYNRKHNTEENIQNVRNSQNQIDCDLDADRLQTEQKQQRTDLDEKSFDLQFQRWEEQFEQWKLANANHPDREMYRRYEQEFEKQRQRIMERREQMRLRKLQQMGKKPDIGENEAQDSDDRLSHKRNAESKADENPNEEVAEVINDQDKEEEHLNQPASGVLEVNKVNEKIKTLGKPTEQGNVETKQLDDRRPMEKVVKCSTTVSQSSNDTSTNHKAETKSIGSLGILGKRKSRFSAATEDPKTPKLSNAVVTEIISLVEDEENNTVDSPGDMCNIFGKSEGIPGLDLVEGGGKIPISTVDESSENMPSKETTKQEQPDKPKVINKIPSLFDVVVEKPTDFLGPTSICDDDEDERGDGGGNDGGEDFHGENRRDEQQIHPHISNAIPNLGDALRDPIFMQKISQALAKAQGRESADPSCAPPPQFLQQLPMLLQQLQKQKSNNFGPNYGGNGPNFGGPNWGGPNFSGNRPNFGGNGPNFGGMGGNFDFDGPNCGNGPNRQNYNRNGPNFNRFGPGGSNFGDGYGPNFRGGGPNFGDDYGPNFQGDGPNFSGDYGPNFRGEGPNFRSGNGPNYGDGGNGSKFGRNAPNDDRRNFGRNNRNMEERRNYNSSRRGGGADNKGRQSPDAIETSKSSWVDGPGNKQDYGDDYFRPVQVIDYQNTAVPKPKVIDYGHKGASTTIDTGSGSGSASGSLSNPFNRNEPNFTDEFKPVKTFEYGHASNPTSTRFGNLPMNVNPKKKNKNKKKKKKNDMTKTQPSHFGSLNDNKQPSSKPTIPGQDGEQTDTEKKSEHVNAQESAADPIETISTNVSSPNGNNDELEAISDNEENLENNRDCESPAPPPPPMLTTNRSYVCSVQQDATAPTQSLFPSTAAANENVAQLPSGAVQMSFPSIENKNTITVDEILLKPGRLTRPKKVCVILRGPPGSGKSYVAKLIKEKELEMGGTNPRVLSIDDYFLIENDYEERCPKTGKKIPKKEVLYEYDADMEDTYMQYLIKSFKKTISDNLYDFIIIDCNNNSLRTLNEFYCHSKDSGFMVSIFGSQSHYFGKIKYYSILYIVFCLTSSIFLIYF